MSSGLRVVASVALTTMALTTAAVCTSSVAFAHGAGRAPEPTLEELPDGPLKKRLTEAQADAKKATGNDALVKRPVREALRAHERSRGALAADDKEHAGQLATLAKRWATAAGVLVRAVKAEVAADKVQKEAVELSNKLERAELLLAEQQSRLGRLKAAVAAIRTRVAKRQAAAAAKEKARAEKKPKRRGGRR